MIIPVWLHRDFLLKFAQTLDFLVIMMYNNISEVFIMQQEILNQITNTVTESAKELLGDKLHSVILYGSYARGDFNEDSDIDIMVLADIDDKEIWRWRRQLNKKTGGLDLEHNIVISVHMKNKHLFDSCIPILPFYQNVVKDGVTLYAN